uniref:Uncharacterized protein n=1 Tax=Alsidium seaforthii TaxID=2007182 RepID=A0A1Z1MD90_9FLOR|nr:hypothetical protein [Bryothamnion seaforthii]ARW64048.1 hypothetical protein [Bryothamnion seaforthii]
MVKLRSSLLLTFIIFRKGIKISFYIVIYLTIQGWLYYSIFRN